MDSINLAPLPGLGFPRYFDPRACARGLHSYAAPRLRDQRGRSSVRSASIRPVEPVNSPSGNLR